MGINLRSLDNRRFFVLAIASAILLRLLLMPFFSHVDLFSEYRRVFFALDNDLYFASSHRLVTYYIEMIFAAIAQLVVPISEAIFYLPDPSKSTASVQDYFLFLQDPYIFRLLFIFKLPYFIFDMAVAALLWRFIDDPSGRRLGLLLWLFNPLTLFATYIFGRFEVISLFFLALTVWQLKQNRSLSACVCFVIALHCREINLLFTPFLLLALIDFKQSWLRNVGMFLIFAGIITIGYLLPDWLFAKIGNTSTFIDPDTNHLGKTINTMFSLGYYWFFPVVIGLGAVSLYSWEQGSLAGGTTSSAERFTISAALALCIYFAFNVHSVHYPAWLVIFPVLALQYKKQVVMPFVLLFAVWIVLWLLKTDGGVFTPFLAAPLSLDFVGIGHFPTWFNQHLATEEFDLLRAIHSMRSLFALSMAYFCYRLTRPA